MKKKPLTKEDIIILKKGRIGFSFPVLFIILLGLSLWCSYIYYFRENYFENHHRSYILDLFMFVLVGIVLIILFTIVQIERLLGYKLIFEGYIDKKQTIYDEGVSYYFFIRERKISVSKVDYESFEEEQKIRVELTSIFKQTIRVLPL